ncbi:MAG: glucan biosynthesis protein G [Burkholderiales bacterium]
MHRISRHFSALRWHLASSVLGLLFMVPTAQAASGFGLEQVTTQARERAAMPYVAPAVTLSPALRDLTYDQQRDIRFKPDHALWRKEQLPFELMFFHPTRDLLPVRINELTANGVQPVTYRSDDFSFGANKQLDAAAIGSPGLAGFRVHYALNNAAYKDEAFVALGASYFRAVGVGQHYGLSARGLAIDTAGGAGPEEFPRFVEFWIERPAEDATALVFYALLDSPRATGAYRFELHPGKETRLDVTSRVFLRADAAQPIKTLGIAPLTSMFFFGENQPRAGDFRPEVHDSDGLLLANGDGEWIWRPLANPATTLLTSFALTQPKGFGLMQRDRDFNNYQDTEARYEQRPSAWVETVGDWGAGRVELLQFRTPDETHDNVVAYWVPAKLPTAGEPLALSYRLHWQGDTQQRPPNGYATQSRRGVGWSRLSDAELRNQVQYVVDFTGPALDALTADAPVKAVASADANGQILENNVYRNPVTGSWRMTLRVARTDPAKPVELRAFLQNGNDTLSETWSQLVIPE